MGRRSIVKERFSKKYRHPSLDAKLTLKRLNAVSFYLNCCSTGYIYVLSNIHMHSIGHGKYSMQEARCLTKARRLGISTPVLYAVDPVQHTLTFEYVVGPSVKDVFLEFGLHGVVEEQMGNIATQIGDAIAKLHDGGIIHGDLTTSNMLLRSGTNELVSI